MGIELTAFLGKRSELREWKLLLPAVVVCRLGNDLGLVPVTGELFADIAANAGHVAADNVGLAYARDLHGWGSFASGNATVAYISVFEFGDDYDEEAILWSGGTEISSGKDIEAVFRYFRDHARIDTGGAAAEIGKYRGEEAAEKWAAAGILDDLIEQGDAVSALAKALRYERKSRSIQTYAREFAAKRLGAMGSEARDAIPALIRALRNEQWTIRYEAARALGSVNPGSTDVRSALAAAGNDENDLVRRAAGEALARRDHR